MEMLGVLALCFFGGASCIMKAENKGNLVSVALAHMFILAALIYVGAGISGGHYNPAVTLGLMITGKIWWWHAILYFIFQTIGSLLAGILLRYTIPVGSRVAGGLGFPTVMHDQIGGMKAFICEMICNFSAP
jgi:glycerol uptake facilitator-like aquaporin